MRNSDAKKYLNSWKVFFSKVVRGKPSFHKLVLSLFKLIQFVCLVMKWQHVK